MPERIGPNHAHARKALIGQLEYLANEVEGLATIIGRVPEAILSGRPLEGEWSIKEIYGLIAAADESVRLPNVQAIIRDDQPELEKLDEPRLVSREAWNEHDIQDILKRVRAARSGLVDFLQALPPEAWNRTGVLDGTRMDIYEFAFHITQEDTDYLRALGYRLHESHLTSRPYDLPK